MQVGKQLGHLLVGEAASKSGHHSLPCQDILPHGHVSGWNTAGEGLADKDAMQIRRYLFQRQVVVFVTMGAADLIEVLAFSFLRGERRSRMAASQCQAETGCQMYTNKGRTSFSPECPGHAIPTPSEQIGRLRSPS